MTRDKVGVGWQHAAGVAGGPKCGFWVGCIGGGGGGAPPSGHGDFAARWWWRRGAVSLVRRGQRCSSLEAPLSPVTLLAGLGRPRTWGACPTPWLRFLAPRTRPPVQRQRRSRGSPAWSRVGAGKLRSLTLGVVVCPGRHLAQAGHCSITSRLPGLSVAVSQSNRFHLSSLHECTEPEREERRLSSLPRLLF